MNIGYKSFTSEFQLAFFSNFLIKSFKCAKRFPSICYTLWLKLVSIIIPCCRVKNV